MKVYLSVEMDVDMEKEREWHPLVVADLLASYQPTPESPEAPDEWLAEEIAMARLDSALPVGMVNITVTDRPVPA